MNFWSISLQSRLWRLSIFLIENLATIVLNSLNEILVLVVLMRRQDRRFWQEKSFKWSSMSLHFFMWDGLSLSIIQLLRLADIRLF